MSARASRWALEGSVDDCFGGYLRGDSFSRKSRSFGSRFFTGSEDVPPRKVGNQPIVTVVVVLALRP